MTNKEIGAAAGFYRAGEARFTISFRLHIFHKRLLPSSCSLLPNYCGTKTSISSLCLF